MVREKSPFGGAARLFVHQSKNISEKSLPFPTCCVLFRHSAAEDFQTDMIYLDRRRPNYHESESTILPSASNGAPSSDGTPPTGGTAPNDETPMNASSDGNGATLVDSSTSAESGAVRGQGQVNIYTLISS